MKPATLFSLPSLQPYSPALDPRTLSRVDIPGLYVHVPFCFHKCHYCDFYSITRQTPERMAAFVDRTLRELDLWRETQSLAPRTIFFGGGTPSLLPIDEMRRLLIGLRDRLDLSRLEEWTIEVNPATTSLAYLAMLRELGVDRISMGAQSFEPAELQMLERHHEPSDVERSVDLCRQAGFSRMNIDLIYAIPGQTLESFANNLRRSLALNLPHYSCYNLTYEPNTPMAVKQRLGRIETIAESIELDMLKLARQTMADAGRLAYEISNYAVPREACRHNLLYWRGENYLGIGPSAASHLSGLRLKNRSHLREWETAIDAGTLPACDVERLTDRQRQGEFVMLGLRLAEGVLDADFADRFGVSLSAVFGETISHLRELGLITFEQTLRLTAKGLPVADAVAAEFLVEP